MYFQTSPYFPGASGLGLRGLAGLGFVFDDAPYARALQTKGTFPFSTTGVVPMWASGVRRTNAETGRMGGQRRTTWMWGVNSLGELAPVPATQTQTQPSAPEDMQAAAGAGIIVGGVAAAVPALLVGLLLGYLIWGGDH